MKKFIVDTGKKKYSVEANDAEHAVKLVKKIDDETSQLQTVNALIEDEKAAVAAYNVAIENLRGKIPEESVQAIIAIRDDENRHIENLQAVVNGTFTEKNLEDSMMNDAYYEEGFSSTKGELVLVVHESIANHLKRKFGGSTSSQKVHGQKQSYWTTTNKSVYESAKKYLSNGLKDSVEDSEGDLKDSGPRYLVTAIFKKPFNQYNEGDKIERIVEGETAAANTRAFLSGNYHGYVNVTLRRLGDSRKMFKVVDKATGKTLLVKATDSLAAVQRVASLDSISLGGGMSLPHQENWCVFVSTPNKQTTIKLVKSKEDFKASERTYGSFVGVGATAADAKKYAASFTGPAKEFPVKTL